MQALNGRPNGIKWMATIVTTSKLLQVTVLSYQNCHTRLPYKVTMLLDASSKMLDRPKLHNYREEIKTMKNPILVAKGPPLVLRKTQIFE